MDGISETLLLQFIEELSRSMTYLNHSSDLNSITSKRDYLISRYYDKLITVSFNLIKITNIHRLIKFSSIENCNLHNFEVAKKESDIELISIMLRSLVELYLELRSIEIGMREGLGIEELSHTIISYSEFENNCAILETSKKFYNCEPLYYKRYVDLTKTEFENYRRELSQKKIPILFKINEKYRFIIDDNKHYERIVLGKDFYNLYSFLSKRVHFSKTSYPTPDSVEPMLYLNWCIFIILEIYRIIFSIIGNESDLANRIIEIVADFRKQNPVANQSIFKTGNIVLLHFGVAEVISSDSYCVKLKYIYANFLKPDDIDLIPEHLILKIISDEKLNSVINELYKDCPSTYEFNDFLLKSNKYNDFWYKLFND